MMERDITKALDNYKRWIQKQKTTKGAMYFSDGTQLIKRSIKDGKCNVLGLTMEALEAGFWLGYTAGKREAAKKAKGVTRT